MFSLFKPKNDEVSIPTSYDIRRIEHKLNQWVMSAEREEMFIAENYYVENQHYSTKLMLHDDHK